jgi:dTMP kinase
MFITLEGPEGGGKTTQAVRLADWLRESGCDVLSVREPGGTTIGDAVRRILLDHGAGAMDARAELLLFCASRAQLISEKIRPHLARGGIVVCDRFADSTLAYQGYARGLDLDLLRALLHFATHGIQPDLTLLLDIDVEAGLGRRAREEWNRLDAETMDFHRKVRAGYLTLAQAEPQRWTTIRADRPLDAVAADIRQVVGQKLQHETPPRLAS